MMTFKVDVVQVKADPRLVRVTAEARDVDDNLVVVDPVKSSVRGTMQAGGITRQGEMKLVDGHNHFLRNPAALGVGPIEVTVSGRVNGQRVQSFKGTF